MVSASRKSGSEIEIGAVASSPSVVRAGCTTANDESSSVSSLRDREQIAAGQRKNFSFVAKGSSHDLRFASGRLEALIDGGDGLNARIFEAAVGRFVPTRALGGFEPVINAADEGAD